MELDARDYRRGGLTLAQVNKVHHVHTIARVAEMLGEDEDWLGDVASEMDQEDGLIWVYGPGDESAMAFADVLGRIADHRCGRLSHERSRGRRPSLHKS